MLSFPIQFKGFRLLSTGRLLMMKLMYVVKL